MIKSLLVIDGKIKGDWHHWLDAYLDCKLLSDDHIYMTNNQNSIIGKILNKLRIPLNLEKNLRLNGLIKKNKYDLILLIKPNSILPFLFSGLKTNIFCIPVDNMVKKHNSSRLFKSILKYCKIIFINNGYYNTKSFYTNKNNSKVIFWNRSFSKFHHIPSKKIDYKYEVLFIGSYENIRFEYLNFIAKNNIQVSIFGNGWENINAHDDNLIIYNKAVLKSEYVNAIQSAKINISFLRKIQDDQQTMRTYEIPACGGFMLTERTANHKEIFREGKECEYFESKSELLKKINLYLNNDNDRNIIINNALNKLDHTDTYSGKIERIINEYRNLTDY